jgi:hypothetical protein
MIPFSVSWFHPFSVYVQIIWIFSLVIPLIHFKYTLLYKIIFPSYVPLYIRLLFYPSFNLKNKVSVAEILELLEKKNFAESVDR